MSYDLMLVTPRPGETVHEAAYRDDFDLRELTGPERRRNTRIADELASRYPAFEVFETPGHLEMTEPGGLQVSLFTDSGAISVPFWDTSAEVDVLDRLEDVLAIVLANSDFVAFDPQIEKELTADAGLSPLTQAMLSDPPFARPPRSWLGRLFDAIQRRFA